MSFSARGARSVLHYVHQSFVAELGDLGDFEETDGTPDENLEVETIELRVNSDSESSPTERSKTNLKEIL